MRIQWSLPCPSTGKLCSSSLNSQQAGRAECFSFALLSFCPSDVHNVRATSSADLQFPVGNFSASGGSHLWDIVLLVTAAAVLGRTTSQVLASFCEAQVVPGLLGPTENYLAGSWKQPLCFLLAISTLFSHVHLSNRCNNACQERLLFNF